MLPGKPLATFVCPGHPLLEATTDLVLEQNRDLLRRGAILIDLLDSTDTPRVLFYLQHAIQDGRKDRSGERRIVSRRMQFAEINASGDAQDAGPAPFLDYEPATPEQRALVTPYLETQEWLRSDLESRGSGLALRSRCRRPGAITLHKQDCLITEVQILVHEPGKRYTVHPRQLEN